MRTRPGWTLIEMIVVLGVIGVVFAFAVTHAGVNTPTLVEDHARRFAQEIRAARTEAIAQAGRARIEIAPGAGPEGEDVYRAGAVGEGEDDADLDAAPWVSLTGGVRLSPGPVATGPLGDPAAPLASMVTITCDATGACALGGSVALTFYFTHPAAPQSVRAVSVTEHGSVRFYRYLAGSGTWE